MSGVTDQAVREALAATPGLAGAWLFGSRAQGRARAGSDVDVAVLFDGPPPLEVVAELRARLQEALGMEDVDLVVLDEETPSTLAFDAVSGVPLLVRDPARVAAYVSEVARQHEDDLALVRAGLRARAEREATRAG